MKRRSVIGALVWSATASGIVALFAGENRAISLRLWLAAFAIWFSLALLKRLFADTPLLLSGLRPVVAKGKTQAETSRAVRIPELAALHGLLLRARGNDRVFSQQLQPRLTRLAGHYLPLHHGIDPSVEPNRAAQLLDDLAWLIDDRALGRAPSLEELERFVHLLTNSTRSSTEEAA